MSILCWDKPKKKVSTEEWESITADSAPPGVYSPNMSDVDKEKWKAKKIGGKNPRVEIRKTVNEVVDNQRYYAQVKLVVRSETIVFSSNGRAMMDTNDLIQAINEAREALKE